MPPRLSHPDGSSENGSNNADSRPKLLAGSPEGLSGHVDGRLRQARMNHPKGFTVDDRGNIYVADALNMAIRKISDTGKLKWPILGYSTRHCLVPPSILCSLSFLKLLQPLFFTCAQKLHGTR